MIQHNSFRVFLAVLILATGTGLLHATNTLTLNPTSVSLSCVKGSTSCASTTVTLADSAGVDYFAITASTIPYWLQVGPMTGIATTTTQNITFQPSAASANLAVGVYSGTVQITGTNLVTKSVSVTLVITDSTPGLSVQPADPYNVNWTSGQACPQLGLTVFSTSTVPVPFTATITSNSTAMGVFNWLSPPSVQSIAYNWGTTIPLSVSQTACQQAQAGEILQGQVDIAYATGSLPTVHINITVVPMAVTITSLSPPAVPVIATSTSGSVTIAVTGTNFLQNQVQTTRVFTGSSSSVALCSACTVHVLNSANMTVTIPYDNSGAPFRSPGSLTVGLANGTGTLPQASKNLTITAAPIVYSVTSASSLVEPAVGANPTVAPYDVISIFGANFCPITISQCSANIVASMDSYYRYPTYLTPDNGTHKLTAMFSKTSSVGTAWANVPGYLLFASNSQINAAVPSSIAAQLGTGTVKLVVALDASATNPASANSSMAYTLNVAAVDPGAFTLDSTGQGAILDASSYILNTQSTPAIGGSSTVALYMTGLGVPNSVGTNSPQTLSNIPATCIAPIGSVGTTIAAPTGYAGTVNTVASGGGFVPLPGYTAPIVPWTTIDGAVIRSVLLSAYVSPPCFASGLPVVTIGGVSATVSYAGFVADSIAGLYQVNVAVPNVGDGTAAQYPVIVSMGGVAAPVFQIWVQ